MSQGSNGLDDRDHILSFVVVPYAFLFRFLLFSLFISCILSLFHFIFLCFYFSVSSPYDSISSIVFSFYFMFYFFSFLVQNYVFLVKSYFVLERPLRLSFFWFIIILGSSVFLVHYYFGVPEFLVHPNFDSLSVHYYF